MSNLCSIQKPESMTDAQWNSFTYTWWYSTNGWVSLAGNAKTVPYLFDADAFNITCVAFANSASSGTLLSYQAQINNLQTTVANLNTQISALVAGNTVAPPKPQMISAELALFGAVLACAAAIYGLKQLLKLFTSHPDA